MAQYTVNFINRTTGDVVEVWEMSRPAVTQQDFRNILTNLHFWACQGGCEAEHLLATVLRQGVTMFYVLGNTYMDGCTIWTDMYVERMGTHTGPRYVRTMYIAQ